MGIRSMEGIKKFPDNPEIVKPMINGAVTVKDDGYHILGIAEIKKGKTKEIIDLVNKRNLFIIEGLEGVKFSIEVAHTYEESLSILGF